MFPVEATSTQPCSCTEGYTIVIVLVSLLIVVTGKDKDHQYTELEEVDESKTYEEIHKYSN
uniref:Uncharacterized protein n=1 Tax=Magallana gigas TaxID=29159 RepID=K1PUP2_MAGGI